MGDQADAWTDGRWGHCDSGDQGQDVVHTSHADSYWELPLPEYCEVRRLINLIIRSLLLMAPSVSVVSPRVTGGHLARPVASNVSQSVNELASSAPTFRRAKLDNLKKNIKQAKNALNLTV